jgi:hypothetical protein
MVGLDSELPDGSASDCSVGTAVSRAGFPPKILNITTPQEGHRPLMALRPFFMVSSTASTISFFALHLTQ